MLPSAKSFWFRPTKIDQNGVEFDSDDESRKLTSHSVSVLGMAVRYVIKHVCICMTGHERRIIQTTSRQGGIDRPEALSCITRATLVW